MPASTGGSAGWNGKLASLPRTKNTSSPMPAPIASTATSGRPAGWRSAASGCTSISLIPTRFSSFRVATTAPMTRASCISDGGMGGSPLLLLLQLYFIDDADDGGVDRAVFQARRHPRGASADDEHGLADAGVHRVDGHEIVSFGLAAGIHRTDNEQLVADEAWVLARRDDGPHDFP